MTERKRLQRARMLVVFCAGACPEAVAWRKVKPESKASDSDAARLCRGELRWLSRWMERHPGVPVPDGDGSEQPLNRCMGVADRPCEAEIPRRRKRCTACAAEQRRRLRTVYGRNYYRSHRESLDAKRKERRRRQQQRERAEKAAAAKREEIERRAAMLRMIVDSRTGKKYIFDPKTGVREELNLGGGFGR